ncbi:MAG: hypothetical protein ABSF21_00310 [Dehalococcoidia bacterium]|jgi:hypothetical protein
MANSEEKINNVAKEPFVCKLEKVETLKDYFSLEYGPNGECRPCRIKPLAELYLGNLEKAKADEPAKKLIEAYETEEILTIAETMDNIREDAKGDLRQELERLDCMVQSLKSKEDEDGKEE